MEIAKMNNLFRKAKLEGRIFKENVNNTGRFQYTRSDDEEDSSETETITTEILQTGADSERMKKCSWSHLEALDETLQQLRIDNGLSLKKLKEVIREKGICLADCKEYGDELRSLLKKKEHMRINLEDAKEFKYVKKCLITL